MGRTSAAQVQSNWSSGLQGKGQTNYKSGCSDVSVSPGVQAAAQAQKYLQSVSESVSSGRFAQRQQSYSLSDWKSAATTRGASNLARAATEKAGKYGSQMQKVLVDIYQLSDQIKSMPSNSLEDSIARSNAFIRGMASKKGSY